MLTAGDWYKALDGLAPFDLAEDWDNVGLLVGSRQMPAQRVLLALDITPAVLEEARQTDRQLIISHHPVIFRPFKSLPAESMPYKLAAAGIAAICAHTNLDIARGGVNDALADTLGLQNTRPLVMMKREAFKKLAVFVPEQDAENMFDALCRAGAGAWGNYRDVGFFAKGEGRFTPLAGANPAIGAPGAPERVGEIRLELAVHPRLLPAVLEALRAAHPYEEPAFDIFENGAMGEDHALGRVGELPAAMSARDFAAFVKERLGAPGLRLVEGGEAVKTVAVCGGGGAEYMGDAKRAGAQALVTGEAKHSWLLAAAELGLSLVDAGHYATEAVVLEPLARRLGEIFPEADVAVASSGGDGVQYL